MLYCQPGCDVSDKEPAVSITLENTSGQGELLSIVQAAIETALLEKHLPLFCEVFGFLGGRGGEGGGGAAAAALTDFPRSYALGSSHKRFGKRSGVSGLKHTSGIWAGFVLPTLVGSPSGSPSGPCFHSGCGSRAE